MDQLPLTLQHKIFDYCQYKTSISSTSNNKKFVIIIRIDSLVFCYSYKAVLTTDQQLNVSTIKAFANAIEEFSNAIKQNKNSILPNINNPDLPFLEYNNGFLKICHSNESDIHFYNNNFFSLKLNSESNAELIYILDEIKEWIYNKFDTQRKKEDCILI